MNIDYSYGNQYYQYFDNIGIKSIEYEIMAPEQSQSRQPGMEYLMNPRPIFDNPDYKDTVTNTLLSKNNIKFSHACGYIGEIHPQSTLEPGKEQFSSGFYTYQASTEYALVYDGVKIESARACKEQPEIKEQIKSQLQILEAQKRNQKQKAEEQSEGR